MRMQGQNKGHIEGRKAERKDGRREGLKEGRIEGRKEGRKDRGAIEGVSGWDIAGHTSCGVKIERCGCEKTLK